MARLTLRALVLCTLAWAVAAGTAQATPLSPTPNALPGSTFQGADGDQDDAPSSGLIDWQNLEAGGHVHHSPDPNAEDDAFTGGTKEDEPKDWDLTTESGGVDPGKNNIRDAWSAVRQPGGNTFLYLGFTREKEEGTTDLAFELNADGRLWHNGHARIPCRRTGDVLIAYEAKGKGGGVGLHRCPTEATDPDTGCARTGHLDDYTSFTPNTDVQGAVNSQAIASRLPGAYSRTVPKERFGEAALNLARVLDEAFDDDCLAFRSVWMHSRSSISEQSNMQDYVAPQPLDVRTCSASGVKFFDRDADGMRDPDDPGIPRFQIFADYDDDGRLDRLEPRTLSDNDGQWVLYDIRPPDGDYRLRETTLVRRSRTQPVATDWVCSYPNDSTPGGTGSAPEGRFRCAWGPLDVDEVPNARGRDFGNWFPARLTVEKVVEPADDPGLFDLFVNRRVVLPSAGDGSSTTISVPPGTYTVSELAAAGTNASDYRSTVQCRRNPTRRGGVRLGTVFESIELFAGDRATCTFRNIRPGSPAIAIEKVGPELAEAGDALQYGFYVTNPGDVPFPESGVEVADERCDDPPELDEKQDGSGADDSPGTLDPGDTWVYRCANRTAAPGDDCEPSRIDNIGTVSGSAEGTTVDDEDSASTVLLCPSPPFDPVPPPTTPPGGQEPGPVAPPGRTPPEAGAAGVASLKFRQATRGCISGRVRRLDLSGSRIRRVRVFVNGRRVRSLTVRTLQRRLTPRVTIPPGRYRVTALVTFQPGAGTPPVRLSRIVRVCAAAVPPVTG
jgi:Prealbumin-like fold domain